MATEPLKKWLDTKWMGNFTYVFLQNGYTDPDHLLSCSPSDLRSILNQIDKPGHRLKVRLLIDELKASTEATMENSLTLHLPKSCNSFTPLPSQKEEEHDEKRSSIEHGHHQRHRSKKNQEELVEKATSSDSIVKPRENSEQLNNEERIEEHVRKPVLDHRKSGYRQQAFGALASEFRLRATAGQGNLRPTDFSTTQRHESETKEKRSDSFHEAPQTTPQKATRSGSLRRTNVESVIPPNDEPQYGALRDLKGTRDHYNVNVSSSQASGQISGASDVDQLIPLSAPPSPPPSPPSSPAPSEHASPPPSPPLTPPASPPPSPPGSIAPSIPGAEFDLPPRPRGRRRSQQYGFARQSEVELIQHRRSLPSPTSTSPMFAMAPKRHSRRSNRKPSRRQSRKSTKQSQESESKQRKNFFQAQAALQSRLELYESKIASASTPIQSPNQSTGRQYSTRTTKEEVSTPSSALNPRRRRQEEERTRNLAFDDDEDDDDSETFLRERESPRGHSSESDFELYDTSASRAVATPVRMDVYDDIKSDEESFGAIDHNHSPASQNHHEASYAVEEKHSDYTRRHERSERERSPRRVKSHLNPAETVRQDFASMLPHQSEKPVRKYLPRSPEAESEFNRRNHTDDRQLNNDTMQKRRPDEVHSYMNRSSILYREPSSVRSYESSEPIRRHSSRSHRRSQEDSEPRVASNLSGVRLHDYVMLRLRSLSGFSRRFCILKNEGGFFWYKREDDLYPTGSLDLTESKMKIWLEGDLVHIKSRLFSISLKFSNDVEASFWFDAMEEVKHLAKAGRSSLQNSTPADTSIRTSGGERDLKSNPSSSPRQATRQQKFEQALDTLCLGMVLRKFSNGHPHTYVIWCTDDLDVLYWGSDVSEKPSGSVSLKDIVALNTESSVSKKPDNAFCIRCRGFTMEFEARTHAKKLQFMHALQCIIDSF